VSGRSLVYLHGVEIERVKGVGGRLGPKLREAGISSVGELLMHYPRRHVDRSLVVPISRVPPATEVTVVGVVRAITSRRPRRGLTIVEAQVVPDVDYEIRSAPEGVVAVPLDEASGMPVMTFASHREAASWIAAEVPGIAARTLGSLWVTFFNQAFRERQLPPGTEVALSGKAEHFRGRLQMKSPVVDVLGRAGHRRTGRIVPVYPSAAGIASWRLEEMIANALRRSRPLDDPVPEDVLSPLGLVSRDEAVSGYHFPDDERGRVEAHRRLVFDELFRLQVALALAKHRLVDESEGIAHTLGAGLADAFLEALPFALTRAQLRVIDDIRRDMASPHPMHRLLQGDVGSGKTVVAMAALLTGVQGGYQGAVMAPTEVLAEQHFLGLEPLVRRHAVRMALLTSSSPDRESTLERIRDGTVDIVVGTHALIQEGVRFRALGIAVIDEQHRFGVHQRVQLREQGDGPSPDLLIMTATPIPRTLSMTLYGDLDVSMLDEMPAERPDVTTEWVGADDLPRVYNRIREQAETPCGAAPGGRKAFVVCPLVTDSDKLEAASAIAEYERLQGVFADLRVGLIHGQMRADDKREAMAAFRGDRLDVLVATTVIEVGIDVPCSTVMLVEDADRFGLSQLHQLRGRLSRGVGPNWCYLLAEPTTAEAQARLAAMVATNDGFRLAEEDLRIRGQGTVFGERQAGSGDLRLADILRDATVLVAARRAAFSLVAADPDLAGHPGLREEVRVLLGDKVDWLFRS